MPRDLPLSNGHLMVAYDSTYSLCDIYYPHVGMENHSYHGHSKLGIWADGKFAWLDGTGWERSLRYQPDSLVTNMEARHDELGIAFTVNDTVDFDRDVLLRRFTVQPLAGDIEDVRVFFHLDIALGGNTVGDTVFYFPESRALVAYKNVHYLLLGGATRRGPGLDGWSAEHKEPGRGSWCDAEDGELDDVPIAFGSVDCVAGLHLGSARADAPARGYAWLAAGPSLDGVVEVHDFVVERGPEALIARTQNYWQAWVAKESEQHPGLRDLPPAIQELYRRSLLIARAAVDYEGAIVASPDSEISAAFSPYGRSGPALTDVFRGHENYAYSWPRDGSLVAMALDNAGYTSIARAYLGFCARVMTERPDIEHAYVLQKYLPNGSVASNVIPWIDEHGSPALPIQEDETALVLIAMRNHYDRSRDWDLIALHYRLITRMANFLADFRDPAIGLPLPSQDLWEERHGTHAFTAATVWRALRDAAWFTALFSEPDLTRRYLDAADEIRAGVERYLFDDGTGRFARSVQLDPGGPAVRDMTVDASLWALTYFSMFPPDDPRIVATMDAVASALAVAGEHGGISRFQGDIYQLRTLPSATGSPSNPWFICTLWLVQYRVMSATRLADLEEPLWLLERLAAQALPSGVLSEQIDPLSGEPAGATPLTWSHGTVILAVLEYVRAHERLQPRPDGV